MSGEKTVWVSRSPGMEVVVVTDYEPDWRVGMNCFDYWLDKPFWTFDLYAFEALMCVKVTPREAIQIRLSVEVIQRLKGGQ